ncbi:hypothetical protein EKD16_24860 [Streptomonospora litoralis]|uniref:Pentapeptide repeat-containing protein n=2 Tax=Streptomonospora litoralis TaxID=2498135 RepID=A0A4P6Q7M2_9ACTN|nr:hypothetical protein EKD16_24860 [Streptomonospora litoralis]
MQTPSTGDRRLAVVIAAGWGAATVLVLVLCGLAWLALGMPRWQSEPIVTPRQAGEILRMAFAVVAGLGGVALLVIAYRRQRTTENGEQRENTRMFTDRFTTAAGQLGDPQPAVRLAGVHALTHLADDAPANSRVLRQMCIDVLCAYFRMPMEEAPQDPPSGATPEELKAHHAEQLTARSMREIRATIMRVIADHLRKGIGDPSAWHGYDLDFRGSAVEHCDFSGALFIGGRISFAGAGFQLRGLGSPETPFGAELSFAGARFAGAYVDFSGAGFHGGRLSFAGAAFDQGEVSFAGAGFRQVQASFAGAMFDGGRLDFDGAGFSACEMSFAGAEITSGAPSADGAGFSHCKLDFVDVVSAASAVLLQGASFADCEIRLADDAKGTDSGSGNEQHIR